MDIKYGPQNLGYLKTDLENIEYLKTDLEKPWIFKNGPQYIYIYYYLIHSLDIMKLDILQAIPSQIILKLTFLAILPYMIDFTKLYKNMS